MADVHAHDCAPCHAARRVVVELRTEFDPLDNWDEVEAQGKTTADVAVELVARVLHRYPIPGGPA